MRWATNIAGLAFTVISILWLRQDWILKSGAPVGAGVGFGMVLLTLMWFTSMVLLVVSIVVEIILWKRGN